MLAQFLFENGLEKLKSNLKINENKKVKNAVL